MTKAELDALLNSVLPNVKEGTVPTTFKTPYLAYWEMLWEFSVASDQAYHDIVTYQVSFFADRPRHPKLMLLMKELRKLNIYPDVRHEFVDDMKCLHSTFAIEVVEDLFDDDETET